MHSRFVPGCLALYVLAAPFSAGLASSGASTNDCDHPSAYFAHQSSSVVWENDALSVGRVKTDEYYTQGMRVSYTFEVPDRTTNPDAKPPDKTLESWNRFFCRNRWRLTDPTGGVPVFRSETVFFGQHMFTPENITLPDPPLDDRPYAAWLYIGTRLTSIVASDKWATYSNVEFQVGVVGPPAQGKWVQTQFHKLIGAHLPQGWDTQVPTEPGVFGSYGIDWRRRPEAFVEGSGWGWDTIPSAKLGLGTIQDYVQTGVQLRVGRNMRDPIHYLTPTVAMERLRAASATEAQVAQALPASSLDPAYLSKADRASWLARDDGACIPFIALIECSLSVGVNGRLVGRNAFLQGTLFSDSRHVEPTPAYYDLTAGVRFRWPDFVLDYQFIRRSKEFTPVPMIAINKDGHHDYGSVTANCVANVTPVCPVLVGLLLVAMAFK